MQDTIATTNATVGQLRAGERFKSHSRHPSMWRMICRQVGGVRVRRTDGHEATVTRRVRVYSLTRP